MLFAVVILRDLTDNPVYSIMKQACDSLHSFQPVKTDVFGLNGYFRLRQSFLNDLFLDKNEMYRIFYNLQPGRVWNRRRLLLLKTLMHKFINNLKEETEEHSEKKILRKRKEDGQFGKEKK